MESIYQMGNVISVKTIQQAFQVNAQAILSRLEERV